MVMAIYLELKYLEYEIIIKYSCSNVNSFKKIVEFSTEADVNWCAITACFIRTYMFGLVCDLLARL